MVKKQIYEGYENNSLIQKRREEKRREEKRREEKRREKRKEKKKQGLEVFREKFLMKRNIIKLSM